MGRASDVRRALIHGIGGALTTSGAPAVLLLLAAASCLIGARAADAQSLPAPATKTRVVLLGTGTPPADPDRSGPATAIVVNDTPYLVDFGAGVVRRAKAAVAERGITALEPANLRVVFLTHLHSDHTIGYPDLILTPWVLGRKVPLEVFGPPGIKELTAHIQAAYGADIETRSKHFAEGLYSIGTFPGGHEVNAHEVKPGVVYKDANVTVTAFATSHAMPSYGYRFDTADRSIVISGDTGPTQAVVDACNGCDLLIHEVLTHGWLAKRPDFHRYAARFHTTSTQLADLASRAKPRLLVLHHASIAWRPVVDSQRSRPEELLDEMMMHYAGRVVVGRDLDVY